MTDKTFNRILMALAITAALVTYALVAHMEYTEARVGKNCETDVRVCG